MSRWLSLPVCLLLALLWTLPGSAATPDATPSITPGITLALLDHEFVITRGETRQSLPRGAESLLTVQNAPLRALQLMPDEAKSVGLESGLYLFNLKGELVSFLADDSGIPCAAVALSPAGKVLAVDSGTWVVRSWSFYTFPTLKSLGGLTYLATEHPLVWHGDNTTIVLTQEDVDQKRQCDYDPCGPVSVERVDLWPFAVTPLFKGTDLCDYDIIGYANGLLEATETCAQSLEGWSQLNDASRVTRPLTKALDE